MVVPFICHTPSSSFLNAEEFPVRELVRAAVSVARHSGNMHVLSDLIPIIDKHSNPVVYPEYT